MSERHNDVDWLRVFAVLILLFVHTAAIFDPFPITAVKGQSSFAMALFAAFVHEWRLAIIFIVSGASAYFALGFLSKSQFVLMRVRRIVVPLVVGTFFIVPIQIYLWVSYHDSTHNISYLHFYSKMMRDAIMLGRFGSGADSLHWGHLWFLAYLFVISMVTLPLLVWRRREKGRQFVSRLAGLCQRRGVFVLALPLVVSELCLRTRWPGYDALNLYNDWANVSFYLIIFLYGFVIYSNKSLRELIIRSGTIALVCGVISSAIFLSLSFSGRGPVVGYNIKWMLFLILRGFNSSFWIIVILSFGMKYLNFRNRLLSYANEAVYPIYIIHLPICSLVAHYVVHWPVGVFPQFLIIVLATLALSLFILEVAIKSTNIGRFLFGLKPKRVSLTRSPAEPVSIARNECDTLPRGSSSV